MSLERTLPREVSTYFQDKRVLVTGGAGFIGSNLAHALVELGVDVTIVDAMLPLYGGNLFNLEDIKDRVRFVEGDVRDKKLMEELVEGKDVIFHFAAQVSYIDSKEQPFLDLDINGKGHLTVVESVRLKAPKAKFLFSSSRLVYGNIVTIPVSESHPTDPLSIYGIHKLLGEKYSRYYSDTFGIHTVSVRIPNPYGPRQQMKHSKYSIVGWFVRQAMEGRTIQVFGDGTQQRDYLYIDDIVDAFLHLAAKGAAGEVYNIGTHERVTFGEMVDAVLKEVGRQQASLAGAGRSSKEFVPWPENYEKNETGDYIADTTKITDTVGWQPRIRLEEGIQRMVEYYKKYHEYYW